MEIHSMKNLRAKLAALAVVDSTGRTVFVAAAMTGLHNLTSPFILNIYVLCSFVTGW